MEQIATGTEDAREEVYQVSTNFDVALLNIRRPIWSYPW